MSGREKKDGNHMRESFVEPGMKPTEKTMEILPARESGAARSKVAETKRKAELRKSIEASTARLMTIAMSRDPDSDPEAA